MDCARKKEVAGMSAIRLLVLGILSKEPERDDDVPSTLQEWHVEQWAGIAIGSIYAALAAMRKAKLIQAATTTPISTRANHATYAITAHGRDEFKRLLRAAWKEHEPTKDPFRLALAFMDRMPRDELLQALEDRLAHCREPTKDWEEKWRQLLPMDPSPLMIEKRRRDILHLETEARWIEEVIAKIKRGELP
jgi:DNA-binding PadR family transcriptional regulator